GGPDPGPRVRADISPHHVRSGPAARPVVAGAPAPPHRGSPRRLGKRGGDRVTPPPAPPAAVPDAVRVAAYAKVNLFLRILARELSGYHQIETAFSLLELADELVVRRSASGVTLETDGPDLGPSDENLAVRAAR